jgi:hypothetical protein
MASYFFFCNIFLSPASSSHPLPFVSSLIIFPSPSLHPYTSIPLPSPPLGSPYHAIPFLSSSSYYFTMYTSLLTATHAFLHSSLTITTTIINITTIVIIILLIIFFNNPYTVTVIFSIIFITVTIIVVTIYYYCYSYCCYILLLLFLDLLLF